MLNTTNSSEALSGFFKLLNPDNTMTINRLLAHAIGVKETFIFYALISKMIYYSDKQMLDEEGFFYATAVDIQESTTYTKKMQMPSLQKLEELGLIKTKYSGLPRRKYYKVVNNEDLIVDLLEQGEKVASRLKAQNSKKADNVQQLQNVTASNDKMSQQEITNGNCLSVQNVTASSDKMSLHTYKSKQDKTKRDKSIHQSKISTDDLDGQTTLDEMDTIDTGNRSIYEKLIKENIEYNWYTEAAKTDWKIKEQMKTVDEIVAIMLDVICSSKPTIRVNSEEMPHETVKSRYLKINQANVDYVMEAMNNSPSQIHNIRNYLITALYNAPTTMEHYYSTQVNNLMYGGDD